ncbi:hypothetical protein ACFRJ8_14850 [Arthrobacter sp. NPDC056886]|uniref:hypothetical protein n=1 Tax=Arthrobacter sp. NPDC056886 TaxID=3345960 RepID=UPI0036704CE6
MNEPTRTFIGENIDGGERVTIEHFPAYGEVCIRVGGVLVATVDASEFFSEFAYVA